MKDVFFHSQAGFRGTCENILRTETHPEVAIRQKINRHSNYGSTLGRLQGRRPSVEP